MLDEEPKAFNSGQQESIVEIERERLELAKQKLALLESSHTLQERMVVTLDGILKELQSSHSTFGQHLVAYALPSGSSDAVAELQPAHEMETSVEPPVKSSDVKPSGSEKVGRPSSPTVSVTCGTSENTETRPSSPTISMTCDTSENT